MRRPLLIVIVIVAILIVGALAYFFFSRGSTPAPITSPGTTGNLPQVGTQGTNGGTVGTFPLNNGTAATGTASAPLFGIISNEPVAAYAIDAQNNVVIVEPDGRIARIAGGQASFLSSTAIQNLFAASFSRDGAKALVSFGGPANPQTSMFDLATKAWTPLAAGIVSPVWSPIDNRIAYLKMNADGSASVMTLDLGKLNAKPVAVLTTHLEDISLAWPTRSLLVLATKPSISAEGGAWTYDIQKNTLSEPVAPQYGFTALWSGTTSSAAVGYGSPYVGQAGTLWLWIPGTSSTRTLNFTTLPSKCAFRYEGGASSSTASYLALYCGVSANPAVFQGNEPDAYNQKLVLTEDAFYRIHTDNGSIETLYVPNGIYDGTNLKVSGNTLFFVNRYDQKLYAISLPAPAPVSQSAQKATSTK